MQIRRRPSHKQLIGLNMLWNQPTNKRPGNIPANQWQNKKKTKAWQSPKKHHKDCGISCRAGTSRRLDVAAAKAQQGEGQSTQQQEKSQVGSADRLGPRCWNDQEKVPMRLMVFDDLQLIWRDLKKNSDDDFVGKQLYLAIFTISRALPWFLFRFMNPNGVRPEESGSTCQIVMIMRFGLKQCPNLIIERWNVQKASVHLLRDIFGAIWYAWMPQTILVYRQQITSFQLRWVSRREAGGGTWKYRMIFFETLSG